VTTGAAEDLGNLSKSIIQAGSKSFAAAARLFDADTRESAYLLYAWCRHCDDVIDGQSLGFQRRDAAAHDPLAELSNLRRQTAEAIGGGETSSPIFEALQRVVQKHGIPSAYPFALLDGFQMDVEARRYDTLDETLTYCYHVAGVVGIMMAMVMGARKDSTLDRANDLGLAFQLTNIARDVIDDARLGRVYLPAQWLREQGAPQDPGELLADRYRPQLAAVVRRLLAEADKYYQSSRAGLPDLGMRSAWAIATARSVYRQIGTGVLSRGPAAWDRRVSTSGSQKLAAVATGAALALYSGSVGRLLPAPPRGSLWTRPRPD
jgi:phytoene synthase